MKVSAREVYEAFFVLRFLRPGKDPDTGKAWDGVRLPVTGGYWVSRLETKLTPEARILQGKREELIQQYGSHKKEGDPLTVEGDALVSFMGDWSRVLDEIIDIDAPVIKMKHFGEADIDYFIVAALGPFISED